MGIACPSSSRSATAVRIDETNHAASAVLTSSRLQIGVLGAQPHLFGAIEDQPLRRTGEQTRFGVRREEAVASADDEIRGRALEDDAVMGDEERLFGAMRRGIAAGCLVDGIGQGLRPDEQPRGLAADIRVEAAVEAHCGDALRPCAADVVVDGNEGTAGAGLSVSGLLARRISRSGSRTR